LTPETVPLVYSAIADILAPHAGNDLVGVSCIARGADSIFAWAVLDLGGRLEVVLPAADYRERKVKPNDQAEFDELIRRATKVRIMPFAKSNQIAYEAANEALVARCHQLVAVWDGRPGLDKGGTGSVVEYAQSHGVPVGVIWPEGADRG
jgi:hypothetical protein